jgi:hypothetical protein
MVGLLLFWFANLDCLEKAFAFWECALRRREKPDSVKASREDFCRGWLSTGDTGSGKTRSGINQSLFQVFTNDPKWGGL